jgi:hypothetical protein
VKNISLSFLIAVAFLAGCSKPAAPVAAPPTHWEYKVVTIENFNHSLDAYGYAMMQTNVDRGLEVIRDAKNDSGDFHLEDGTDDKYYANINQLGADGWELVSAVPQIETIPDAEKEEGTVFNADSGKLDQSIVKFTNIRTGKIILIFKRAK